MIISFKSKKKKLEERFSALHRTPDRKEALGYLFYNGEGSLKELQEKIHPELIEQFRILGYIKIQGNSYSPT